MKRFLHRLRRLAGACICAIVGHRAYRYADLLASGCTRCGSVWGESPPYHRVLEYDATMAERTTFLCTRKQKRYDITSRPVQRSYDRADYDDIGPPPTLEQSAKLHELMQRFRELKGR